MSRLLTIRTIWRTLLAVHCILLLLWFAVPFPPVSTPDHQSEYIQRQIQAGSRITTVHPYSDTIRHPSRTSSEDSPSPYIHDAWDGHIFTWQLLQNSSTDNIILRLDNPNGITTQNFSVEIDLTALAAREPSFINETIRLSLATGDIHWPVPPYFSYADAIILSHQQQHTWQNGTLRLLVPERGTVQIWKNMPGWNTFNASNIASIDDTGRKQGLVASFSLPSTTNTSTITIEIPHAHLLTITYTFRSDVLTLLTPLFATLEGIFSLLVFVFSFSILLFSLITIIISNIPSLITHLVPLYMLIVLVSWLLFARGAGFRAWSRRFWLTRGWAKWVFRPPRVRVWGVSGPVRPADADEWEGEVLMGGDREGRGGHRRNRSTGYGGVEKGGGFEK
ncbi:hypothetical protein ES702_06126 [subsurface metagenome]